MIKKIFIFCLFFLSSCSEKQSFTSNTLIEGFSGNNLSVTNQENCSTFTLQKPQVDFLFIWDNSTSTTAITNGLRASLNATLDLVSNRFNYHVLTAPLIANADPLLDFNNYSLMVENPVGLNSTALSIVRPRESINLFNNTAAGSIERGFKRAHDIISNNRANGIFRSNAHTIIVMISNEDDDDYPGSDGQFPDANAANDISTHKTNFINLKNNLNALSFRFMSIVGHTFNGCPPNSVKAGNRYKKMSLEMYNQGLHTDNNVAKDSYNICTANFSNLFAGINQSITAVVQKHIYGYWPIANTTNSNFDPGNIQVRKNTGMELVQNDLTNGFRLMPGVQTNINTRLGFYNSATNTISNNPGEPVSGYVIQLFGNGRVTFPECLLVQTSTPAEYYGYAVTSQAPDLNQIEIKVNGQVVNRKTAATPNGWEYLQFFNSKNIKIMGPKNPLNPYQEDNPPILKTGYFFKLHGNAVFTNGGSVTISFKKAPI